MVLTYLQHIVSFLPMHGRRFPFIFYFAVLLTLLLTIVLPPIISPRFLVHLKDVIASPSNVLVNVLLIVNKTSVYSWPGRRLGRICCEILSEAYYWRYFYFGFLKYDFSWGFTYLFNLLFYDISFIFSFHKFSRSILKFTDCGAYSFYVLIVDWMDYAFSLHEVYIQNFCVNSFGDQFLRGKQWFEYFNLCLYYINLVSKDETVSFEITKSDLMFGCCLLMLCKMFVK